MLHSHHDSKAYIEPRLLRLAGGFDPSDLPPPDTKRWVISRKAQVVDAVRRGFITLADVCARYALSEEEIRSWMKLSERGGSRALRVTRLQDYRRKMKGDGTATSH